MESNNNQDNRTFGTDVREEDVSRETTKNDIFQKRLKKKPQLDKVRQKGNITDDNPFDYNNPTLKELYRNFRSGGLTVVESGFNALYLWCYDNYYSSVVPIKDKYKNIYAHPSSWFKNTHHMWKHNKWSVAVKILENAKTSRPSVCNAAEVCLIHSEIAEKVLPMIREAVAARLPEKPM